MSTRSNPKRNAKKKLNSDEVYPDLRPKTRTPRKRKVEDTIPSSAPVAKKISTVTSTSENVCSENVESARSVATPTASLAAMAPSNLFLGTSPVLPPAVAPVYSTPVYNIPLPEVLPAPNFATKKGYGFDPAKVQQLVQTMGRVQQGILTAPAAVAPFTCDLGTTKESTAVAALPVSEMFSFLDTYFNVVYEYDSSSKVKLSAIRDEIQLLCKLSDKVPAELSVACLQGKGAWLTTRLKALVFSPADLGMQCHCFCEVFSFVCCIQSTGTAPTQPPAPFFPIVLAKNLRSARRAGEQKTVKYPIYAV